MAKFNQPFMIRLPKETKEKLTRLAESRGRRQVSRMVREILESYLKEKAPVA